MTLEGPLAGVLRRAAYLYRQPTDQVRPPELALGHPEVAAWSQEPQGCCHGPACHGLACTLAGPVA